MKGQPDQETRFLWLLAKNPVTRDEMNEFLGEGLPCGRTI